MSIGARVSAWWSAWQFVVYLALALAASVALNVWQAKRAITAPLRDEIAGKDRALQLSEQLLTDTTRRAYLLDQAANRAAGQLAGAATDYRKAVAIRPLTPTQCAPGQSRMDAVNRAAGAGDSR